MSGSRPQYAYHVTLREFLPSIREDGLVPQWHEGADRDVIFVERTESEAAIYHEPGSVMLRVQVNGYGCTEGGEDVLTWVVPPGEIFIRDGDQRTPLLPAPAVACGYIIRQADPSWITNHPPMNNAPILARSYGQPAGVFKAEQIRSLTVALADEGKFRVEVQNSGENEEAFTVAGVFERFDEASRVADTLNRAWTVVPGATSAQVLAFVSGEAAS